MTHFDRQDTKNKVIAVVAKQLKIDAAQVSDDATLEGLGADSLAIFEIIINLEDLFAMQMSDDEVEKLQSLPELISYIHERRTQ